MIQQLEVATSERNVYEVLSALDRGNFPHDLELGIKKVVEAVVTTQRKGKVVIELDFGIDPKIDAMMVTSKIKLKVPEPQPRAALFFVTPENNLSRHDHRQATMFHDKD